MESERIELQKSLVNEISKGMRQMKQVKRQMKQVKVSSSEQERGVERMLSSYEEALFILTGRAPEGQCQSVITSSSDPNPPTGSVPLARKGGSRSVRKRRRVVKINAQGTADDGYSWRKYGEKPILNSIYPRSYFRCSVNKSCGARKHERRSENDPTTIDVTYTGVHTCQPKSMVVSASSNMGHIVQDREYLKTPPMDLNLEIADNSEFLDLSDILD